MRRAEHVTEFTLVSCPLSRFGVAEDGNRFLMESLILAQNERWQRGLGMQVERDPLGSILRKSFLG